MAQDNLGLVEDERDAAGELVLSEIGERFKEITEDAMKIHVDDRMDQLVETVDAYFELVNENAEESVAELRKLMLLAVASIGGQEKAREFIRKVGETGQERCTFVYDWSMGTRRTSRRVVQSPVNRWWGRFDPQGRRRRRDRDGARNSQ